MLRALSAPFPRVRFVPTGGINSANAPAYLSLPSVAAVGGSWIVDPELLATRNLAAVERLASEAVRMARAARP
jgi:2-dehydro-3-deoxyphosphogluconate aldolase/(4S)-4-hydroxy-2-oxoglutarate aldolase